MVSRLYMVEVIGWIRLDFCLFWKWWLLKDFLKGLFGMILSYFFVFFCERYILSSWKCFLTEGVIFFIWFSVIGSFYFRLDMGYGFYFLFLGGGGREFNYLFFFVFIYLVSNLFIIIYLFFLWWNGFYLFNYLYNYLIIYFYWLIYSPPSSYPFILLGWIVITYYEIIYWNGTI